MKAVIMAGGRGTRLRPLTCNKPKPMVPLLGKPVMEYAIDLLNEHGITDIAVTLQYLPQAITDYFGNGAPWGVKLFYSEEDQPLGTAGSVKNAQVFLDDTFVVISGDGLTDIDLSEAISFHKQNNALATLVLTRVESPLEFGVVILDDHGRVCRFLEKPSWGEVFSDTVNTGIYILEPEIFKYIPPETNFDFSKDVFPLLLKQGGPMFGYVANGYWCDIGSLSQYRQTQFDMLDGAVKVRIPGEQVSPGVWLGENVRTNLKYSEIDTPVFIGNNTFIEDDAVIGEYTVLGENNHVGPGTSVKRTVTWNQCYLEKGIKLRGATLCSNSTVKSKANVYEGAVIGDYCTLGAASIIKPNVKIWPAKEIADSTTVHTSLIWGEKLSKNLFGLLGVSGIANVEITPDFASKLAAAYGATLFQGAHILVSADEVSFNQVIRKSLIAGLLSAGAHVTDLGESVTPVTRFAVPRLNADGALHVRLLQPYDDKRIVIEFMDSQGINIDKGTERKIENAFVMEDFRRANMEAVQTNRVLTNIKNSYSAGLLDKLNCKKISSRGFRVVLEASSDLALQLTSSLLNKLKCQVVTLSSGDSSLFELANMVRDSKADLGVRVSRNCEHMVFITPDRRIIKDEELLPLLVLVKFLSKPKSVIAVPTTATEAIEKIASAHQGRVVRTKANPHALMTSG
ncbi:MAG TPA: sugar phosphate nucleotidyltransferase, partial [Bacillota bacterium]|nr:sugar phosphate nucleotidyltransferase [Bacillota bacterium]